jgi:HTH-type transcriptional repressor of NAD biosynthesis genes
MIKGFVIGKFLPFHLGHEALIEYAKDNCDHLTIIVGAMPDEPIPYKYRLKWVLSTYLDDPKVDVFGDIAKPPIFSSDKLKSQWWGKHCLNHFGKFDRVFSSENYGVEFAKSMNAENWVFNKARTIIPVSGTLIRSKPLTCWGYLNNFAKDYFVKKIAIVGTETTGKTTMAQQLAEHYDTVWCPELGRELIPNTKECTIEDLKLVGVEHAKHIIKYTRLSNKLLFIDTDLNITKSYSEFLFNEIPEYPIWVEKANEMHLYIYLMADAPYVNDGTRLSKKERNELDKYHWKNICLPKNNMHCIWFANDCNEKNNKNIYKLRFENVIQHIDEFIKQY